MAKLSFTDCLKVYEAAGADPTAGADTPAGADPPATADTPAGFICGNYSINKHRQSVTDPRPVCGSAEARDDRRRSQ